MVGWWFGLGLLRSKTAWVVVACAWKGSGASRAERELDFKGRASAGWMDNLTLHLFAREWFTQYACAIVFVLLGGGFRMLLLFRENGFLAKNSGSAEHNRGGQFARSSHIEILVCTMQFR